MSTRLLPISACALLALSTVATAQDSTLPLDRWAIDAGGFLTDFDSSLRLSGPRGGTRINFEDTLGLRGDDETFRGRVSYRIADRHRISIGYYAFKRSAMAAADRDFVIETEDQLLEFSAGAMVSTSFDWQLVPIIYRYSFLQTDRAEASIGAGVHWVDAQASIAGEARINEASVGFARENESTSAPLPVFGLDANYAVTNRLLIGGSLQYFGIDLGDIGGDLVDLRFTAEYRWTPNFVTGLGYTWYDIDYEDRSRQFSLNLNYRYEGPEAYIGFRF